MRTQMGGMLLLLILASAGLVKAQEDLRIGIHEIEKEESIKGTVTGLTVGGTAAYKVVVYVKTDRWYIHPYESGGEGKSWAAVMPDGTWKIPTVRREFPASKIAALLVEREAKVPAITTVIQEITNRAMIVHDLEGTADHGKL